MNNQIANTEIRAIDDAELDMISGGLIMYKTSNHVQSVMSQTTYTELHYVSPSAFLGSMDTMSGGPGKSHYSK